MDVTKKQLLSEIREALSVRPGHSQRVNYEYQHEGVAHFFKYFEQLLRNSYPGADYSRAKIGDSR